jgi:hypothetical protein
MMISSFEETKDEWRGFSAGRHGAGVPGMAKGTGEEVWGGVGVAPLHNGKVVGGGRGMQGRCMSSVGKGRELR